jgi:hypothetical protein
MPSSLICSSEDSSLELHQLQIKAQGKKTHWKQDEFPDDTFSIWVFGSFKVASEPTASLSRDFPPTVEAFASCFDEVDPPPSFESFRGLCFSLSGILRYFLDLKTPGSAGSAAAHQIYRPKAQVIWKEKVDVIKVPTTFTQTCICCC